MPNQQEQVNHYQQVRMRTFGRNVPLARTIRVNPAEVVRDSQRAETYEDRLRLTLYAEICSSWRGLVDVRFKLLGLVPSVSAALLTALLMQDPGEAMAPGAGIVLGIFGLLVTVALAVYDQRNSQLHDELISRGRRIEQELGVVIGQFLGRPGSWRFVKHDTALAAIYIVTILAWVTAVTYFIIAL